MKNTPPAIDSFLKAAMAMSRAMSSAVLIAMLPLVTASSTARAAAQPQQSMPPQVVQYQQAMQQRIEHLKLGVVRVLAVKDAKEVGTGIVISSSPQSIFILTALHVVQDAKSVSVLFYSDQTKPIPARKLPKHSTALDLAVLEVDASPTFKIPEDIPTFNFAANNTLLPTQHIYSVNGDWVIVPNNITRLNHDGDPQKFEYSNVSVGEGFSGGPIFDDYQEIIGMHTALNGEGSYAVADKIDSALQVLEALEYKVPKAGAVVIPPPVITPGNPTRPRSNQKGDQASSPCDDGCETTLGALPHLHHYSIEGRAADCFEDVLSFPPTWPTAKIFMHITSCPAPSKYGVRGQPTLLVRFAETDRQGDSDMTLGILSLTGSSAQGMLKDSNNTYWQSSMRNPNFGQPLKLDAITISLKPLVPHH
ncbi:S1 family peptidase [Acidicapsa ligni]|uniref:S1 family peptidase n=1 Tax=Acidicapsa ligni TaxID=542300 RepID=UPI0021E044A8|nr:serine protease [Acidicapsa ligni]